MYSVYRKIQFAGEPPAHMRLSIALSTGLAEHPLNSFSSFGIPLPHYLLDSRTIRARNGYRSEGACAVEYTSADRGRAETNLPLGATLQIGFESPTYFHEGFRLPLKVRSCRSGHSYASLSSIDLAAGTGSHPSCQFLSNLTLHGVPGRNRHNTSVGSFGLWKRIRIRLRFGQCPMAPAIA